MLAAHTPHLGMDIKAPKGLPFKPQRTVLNREPDRLFKAGALWIKPAWFGVAHFIHAVATVWGYF